MTRRMRRSFRLANIWRVSATSVQSMSAYTVTCVTSPSSRE